jgi:hypothetical protein
MRAKYQTCEIEDLDPKTCSEWLDHSYIPFQHSTTSIGSSLAKLKIKCHRCIEAYVTHSHLHQFLSYALLLLPNGVKPSLNLI